MVIKLIVVQFTDWYVFESGVISYGNQTPVSCLTINRMFESGVNSYGNQTSSSSKCSIRPFESGVNSYGNQTI